MRSMTTRLRRRIYIVWELVLLLAMLALPMAVAWPAATPGGKLAVAAMLVAALAPVLHFSVSWLSVSGRTVTCARIWGRQRFDIMTSAVHCEIMRAARGAGSYQLLVIDGTRRCRIHAYITYGSCDRERKRLVAWLTDARRRACEAGTDSATYRASANDGRQADELQASSDWGWAQLGRSLADARARSAFAWRLPLAMGLGILLLYLCGVLVAIHASRS